MIVADASAVLAVILDEPERADFIDRLSREKHVRMSVLNAFECHVRLLRLHGQPGLDEFSLLLDGMDITLEAATLEDYALAHEAYGRFGKGRHPAKLNMGDCFAYALARRLEAPLLYKGGDFAQTDIAAA